MSLRQDLLIKRPDNFITPSGATSSAYPASPESLFVEQTTISSEQLQFLDELLLFVVKTLSLEDADYLERREHFFQKAIADKQSLPSTLQTLPNTAFAVDSSGQLLCTDSVLDHITHVAHIVVGEDILLFRLFQRLFVEFHDLGKQYTFASKNPAVRFDTDHVHAALSETLFALLADENTSMSQVLIALCADIQSLEDFSASLRGAIALHHVYEVMAKRPHDFTPELVYEKIKERNLLDYLDTFLGACLSDVVAGEKNLRFFWESVGFYLQLMQLRWADSDRYPDNTPQTLQRAVERHEQNAMLSLVDGVIGRMQQRFGDSESFDNFLLLSPEGVMKALQEKNFAELVRCLSNPKDITTLSL